MSDQQGRAAAGGPEHIPSPPIHHANLTFMEEGAAGPSFSLTVRGRRAELQQVVIAAMEGWTPEGPEQRLERVLGIVLPLFDQVMQLLVDKKPQGFFRPDGMPQAQQQPPPAPPRDPATLRAFAEQFTKHAEALRQQAERLEGEKAQPAEPPSAP